MKIKNIGLVLFAFAMTGFAMISCTGKFKKSDNMNNNFEKGTFGYDLKYLSEKDSLIVLKSDNGEAQVIVSAKYQAKVFTSTASGVEGKSLGFVNYRFFDSEVVDEHMNGFGGENRLWLGPEGGQYSIYFEPGKEQVFDNWHTPKAIDIETWKIVSATDKEAVMQKDMELTNYLGTCLKVQAHRTVSLISDKQITKDLGMDLPAGVKVVAYATNNIITNKNDFEWTPKTGTICIWMLDMFIPSDSAVTFIPFNAGEEKTLGKIATTNYFGEIPSNRLKIEADFLFLKTDGKYRSKLGMNAKRTKAIAANYDPISKRLTITTFENTPSGTYLNQEWNPKKNPLVGDALNAYNDGPLEDGSIMGPFLELESCSPAAFLKSGESLSHYHNVYHFVGDEAGLSVIAQKWIGVALDKVKKIF